MNIKYIFVIAQKEFFEMKSTLKKLVFLVFYPFIVTFFIGTNSGKTGIIFDPEFNILFTQMFVFIFLMMLVHDSIYREKKQNTLEILLSSNLNSLEIILGKNLFFLFISFVFQALQNIFLFSILYFNNSEYLDLINLNNLIISLNIGFLIGIVSIFFGIILNDDKVSGIISILVSFILGIFVYWISFYFKASFYFFNFITFNIILILINLIVLKICSYFLDKSMFFIKS